MKNLVRCRRLAALLAVASLLHGCITVRDGGALVALYQRNTCPVCGSRSISASPSSASGGLHPKQAGQDSLVPTKEGPTRDGDLDAILELLAAPEMEPR